MLFERTFFVNSSFVKVFWLEKKMLSSYWVTHWDKNKKQAPVLPLRTFAMVWLLPFYFEESNFYGFWGRIFSQAKNELGASSFPGRNELSMLFLYTSFPAGNEHVLKLTKNTASGVNHTNLCFFYIFWFLLLNFSVCQ